MTEPPAMRGLRWCGLLVLFSVQLLKELSGPLEYVGGLGVLVCPYLGDAFALAGRHAVCGWAERVVWGRNVGHGSNHLNWLGLAPSRLQPRRGTFRE